MSEWRAQDFRPVVAHAPNQRVPEPSEVVTPAAVDAANAEAEAAWIAPLPAAERIEREAVMRDLGNYLVNQVGAWNEFDRFVALGAIARLVKLAGDCGDAAGALADLTREVEAALYLRDQLPRATEAAELPLCRGTADNCRHCPEPDCETDEPPARPPSAPAAELTPAATTPRRRRRWWRW